MNSDKLVKILKAEGWEVRPYSGRGMMGRECVGVDVEYLGQAFDVGCAVGAECDYDFGTPDADNMGMGYILYWPSLDWPKGA